jgi:hypothetical protein
MNEKEVQRFLESHEWTYAKTMPLTPHWYIVNGKSIDPNIFIDVVAFIKRNGVSEKFNGVRYKYLILGEFKYWTMGLAPGKTTIINRVPI